MSTTEYKQAPRTAWINAIRAEVLRVGKRIPEVARVAHVGVWIATYADADGTSSFPGRETLAILAGCSQETVTRCVKVLMGVGALERKRRPNASSLYRLCLFLPGGLPWEEHIHHYTDTRQRKAHAKKKAESAAEVARKASMDVVRGAEPDSVDGRGPDSVHGGGSGFAAQDPDSVHGRPRTASVDAFRTASMAGVDKVPPTCGRDPRTDHDSVADSPRPQTRAGAGEEGESTEQFQETTGPAARPEAPGERFSEEHRHCECGTRLVRTDRDLCGGCIKQKAEVAKAAEAWKPVQGTFLLPLTGGGQGAPASRRERPQWLLEDLTVPERVCGCGRSYRLSDSDICPDCVFAAEQQRSALDSASTG
ncbi:hypothetical protein ACFT54_09720 [Streptomyces cinereoruber]|uniref:hypothetical protein n=1 Tax=Streptomyces cinereoruber TaxID=67260 RepID=UPI00363F40D7